MAFIFTNINRLGYYTTLDPFTTVYELDEDEYRQDFVFETNATSHAEIDTWRKEGI
jgi:hypothetical protein